jgi:hypothetical protein
MNLTELNKIEEGRFADAAKSMIPGIRGLVSGQGKNQTKVQDIFIKDFVQDATTSLKNGLAGGLIQLPQKTSGAPADTPPAASTPATPSAPPPAANPKAPAEKQPYKWAPKGMKVNPDTKLSSLGATGDLAESKYENLNKIFESIVNIDEQADVMSMSDYLMSWFSQYMQGVAWEGSKAIVKNKIDAFVKDYPAKQYDHLTNLARTALALSKAATPAGAPKEFTQMRQTSGQDVQQGYEEIKAALDELAKINPDLYNKFIKTLRPVAAQPGASAGLVEQKKRK